MPRGGSADGGRATPARARSAVSYLRRPGRRSPHGASRCGISCRLRERASQKHSKQPTPILVRRCQRTAVFLDQGGLPNAAIIRTVLLAAAGRARVALGLPIRTIRRSRRLETPVEKLRPETLAKMTVPYEVLRRHTPMPTVTARAIEVTIIRDAASVQTVACPEGGAARTVLTQPGSLGRGCGLGGTTREYGGGGGVLRSV
jgi:hypothetical protein